MCFLVLTFPQLAKTQCRVADLPKILTAMDTARSSYTAFDGFDDEFQLVMADHREAPARVGKHASNKRRNRYPNVVPCEKSALLSLGRQTIIRFESFVVLFCLHVTERVDAISHRDKSTTTASF